MTAKIKLNAASGGGSVSLQAPTTTTGNAAIDLQLPVADGSANQFIKTDGSGALSFATPTIYNWVHAAEVSLNGNTSVTLTGVPDGASHIRYLIRYMSFSGGAAQAKFRLEKSTTGGSKSVITSSYQTFCSSFKSSSIGGSGNTDGMDLFDGNSAIDNSLFGSVNVYRIGTNGSDGTNIIMEHQGFANQGGTLDANFMSNGYMELGTGSTDFISGGQFFGNTGQAFDNGYIAQSYLLS